MRILLPGRRAGAGLGSLKRPAAAFRAAAAELDALHPRYLRLLVDWAALQPEGRRPPALAGEVSGCARDVGPCGPYAGLREELAAIAARQRASQGAGPGVLLTIFGAPAWAARAPSGCEQPGTAPFSRPLSAGALADYRSLISSLLALGRAEGVALDWWSPWNEPNEAAFVSPQRAYCAAAAPLRSPAVYAQLARTMAAELQAAGGEGHMVLGELAGGAPDAPARTGPSQFLAALPADVLCLGSVWSLHSYPDPGPASGEPVAELEAALDGRGACGRRARIWITETGAGAPRAGAPPRDGAGGEVAGCEALARALVRWSADPRIDAVFQYTFREDPAYPVGLLSADLTHIRPAYRLWLRFEQRRAAGLPAPAPEASCS